MKREKLILAVETAAGRGCVSLSRGGREIGKCGGKKQVARSTDLLTEISELLSTNNIEKSGIDLIIVSTGPGSYTGARIGIATAKALAFSLGRPCFGVSVLDALAHSFKRHKSVCAVVPGNRESFYFQFFEYNDGRKTLETKILYGDCERLSSQLQRFEPQTIVAAGMDENGAEKLKFKLTAASPEANFINASDNLCFYLSNFADEESEEASENENREASLTKKTAEIQPIYIREADYMKAAVLKDSDK